MSDFFLVAGGVMLLLIPISLIIWLVQAIRKKPTKKNKIICLGCVVLFLAFEVVGMATRCSHAWQNATCTSPKTCTLCGEIEGEPLGHTWVEASCTEPRTCSFCGETEGTALGHVWEDATCEVPKTCSLCGETEGLPLDHIWIEATCTEPRTCSLCGKTEGTTLGHTPGDWVPNEDSRNVASGTIWVEQRCTVCGTSIDKELRSIPMYENNRFVFTPNEYVERLGLIFQVMEKNYNSAGYATQMVTLDDGTMACLVTSASGIDSIAAILFLDENFEDLSSDWKNTQGASGLYAGFYTTDISEITDVMMSMILSCHHAEMSDAVNIAKAVVLSAYAGEPYYYDGVGYVFGESGGEYTLIMSVAE